MSDPISFHAGNFYRYWHSTNESERVLTRKHLNTLRESLTPQVRHKGNSPANAPFMSYTEDEFARFEGLGTLDPSPVIKLNASRAEVRLLEFNPASGLNWIDYRIELPNRVQETARTVLLRSPLPPRHF